MKTYRQFIIEITDKRGIGFAETFTFYNDPKVPKEMKDEHKRLSKSPDTIRQAYSMIEDYIGKKFHPALFANLKPSSAS